MKSWLYYTCHPLRGHIVTLQCHVFPRVLSSLDTRRISLRQSYRAGLGGWEARSVTRDRESLRNGSYEVVPPPVQNVLLLLLRSGVLSPEDKLLICCSLCSHLCQSRPRGSRIARVGPAREDHILPVRDKCGAQRRAVHELPLRLCGATFDSSGSIYALASTHYFVACLSCSRALSTRRCHHIKSFSNRAPSHPGNVERF